MNRDGARSHDRLGERERLADERERVADERERVADEREERSDTRELLLDRWEQRILARAADLATGDGDDDLDDDLDDASRQRRANDWAARRLDADIRRNAKIERAIIDDARAHGLAAGDDPPVDGAPDVLRFTQLAIQLQTITRLADIVDRLLDVSLEIVPRCESACISLSVDGPLATAACTAPWAAEIETAQHARGCGPTHTAILESIVHTADVTADGRWPELHQLRSTTPVRSALGYSLTTGGEPAGALVLYSRAIDAFGAVAIRTGDILAAHASIALDRVLDRLTHEARQEAWQHALASRDVIGQAKGILMEQRCCSADDAFRELRGMSQRLNLKVRDIAEHIVRHRQPPA